MGALRPACPPRRPCVAASDCRRDLSSIFVTTLDVTGPTIWTLNSPAAATVSRPSGPRQWGLACEIWPPIFPAGDHDADHLVADMSPDEVRALVTGPRMPSAIGRTGVSRVTVAVSPDCADRSNSGPGELSCKHFLLHNTMQIALSLENR